jgi:hypothetical protein
LGVTKIRSHFLYFILTRAGIHWVC